MHRLVPLRIPAVILLAALVVASCGGESAAGGVAGAQATPAASPGAVAAPTPRPSPPAAPATPEPTPAPTPGPAATPSPSPAATPAPSPTPKPIPTGPYQVNLYERGDFVSQATKEMCVAGAMHTMLNVGDATDNHSKAFQRHLAELAKALSDHPDGGTEPEGWARALRREGLGRYRVEVAPTRYAAVRLAAHAIRVTGRPVGLLVWRGAHSWVMHGFRATRDPLYFPDARITSVWVTDPWYPRVSSIWGPSNPPNTRVKVADLGIDYLKWRRPTGPYPDKDGQFVLVVPVGR